jgi:hypothetical protein
MSDLKRIKLEGTPKGKSQALWRLNIGTFWKVHFINPPED